MAVQAAQMCVQVDIDPLVGCPEIDDKIAIYDEPKNFSLLCTYCYLFVLMFF